jgi:hypothetical protein
MAQQIHYITQYSYDFDARTGGPRLMQLWNEDGLIADLHFVPDGQPLPAPDFGPNLEWAVTYFYWSSFRAIADMLRHEDFVRVQINNDQPPGFVFVGTSIEDADEE